GRTGDDSAGVPHRLPLRRGEARDVAHDRLGDVLLDVFSGPFFSVTADLTDHHDDVGVRVGFERGERVDVRGADDRVTADTHAGGEANVPQLVHHLVGERAGLGHQADTARLGDVGGDDAGVGLPGGDEAGAVRADDAGLVALAARVGPEGGGVVHRDAFGDDDREADLRVDRFDHRVLGELRRHEDDGDVSTGGLHAFGYRAEDRYLGAVEVHHLAGLARVDTTDDVGARGKHATGVLGALGAGHALDEDLAVLGEEDSHVLKSPRAYFAASSAASAAAPSMVSTWRTAGWLRSLRIERPSSALLPSRRTTSGLVTSSPRDSSSSSACTIPLATASHAVIPPKTFTKTLLTAGSLRMISRPLAMTSAEAPPPM